MKRIFSTLVLAALFTIAVSVTVSATDITFTFTADNVVGAWFQDGAAPDPVTPALTGPNLKNWRIADTAPFTIPTGYHPSGWDVIFQTVNDDNDAGYRIPSASNPGGFMAQMSGALGSSNALSDSTWDVSVIHMADVYAAPSLAQWALINAGWTSATTWADNSGASTWTPVAGIATGANWIWTKNNFAMTDAPGMDVAGSIDLNGDGIADLPGLVNGLPAGNVVFVRAHVVDPVPEPGTLLLLGAGLVGLVGYGKLRISRNNKKQA